VEVELFHFVLRLGFKDDSQILGEKIQVLGLYCHSEMRVTFKYSVLGT
jgi:hypothetical protein